VSYELDLSPEVQRQLKKLPRQVKVGISKALNGLKQEPRPPGCMKLRGYENQWRVRVGQYRIAYEIYDSQLKVHVIEVGKREHFYG
jgi:mRNA interferase RelE/StbE